MQQTIEVKTADFAVATGTYTLQSQGIGSCVVICLYDRSQKIGALCHVMLPKRPDDSNLNPIRFADTAIPLVLDKLAQMGSKREHLVAQLFGGASMFQRLGNFVNQIGGQNIAAVQQILATQGIPIVSMDVGGTKGRNVTFALNSGNISTTSKA